MQQSDTQPQDVFRTGKHGNDESVHKYIVYWDFVSEGGSVGV